jgi:2-(1,2-epoxy-1,2-dihydrophenyl)acetyl-CoA isomerase
MAEYQFCKVADEGRLRIVTLNRPEVMNALHSDAHQELEKVWDEFAARDDLWVGIVTGAGDRAFSAGNDLKVQASGRRGPPTRNGFAGLTSRFDLDKPVIAAVNGVAAGAGASLAFACDLRIVADTAGFNLAFANVALSCDTGSSFTLQRLVGKARAIELLYFPRTVPAEEALELGLATQVVPAADLAEVVAALAARLAAGPTVALGAIRQSVEYAAGHDFAEAAAFESTQMTLTGATADHAAAVAAFIAKEKPVFEGR